MKATKVAAKKAAVYYRVSTKKQAEKESIESQQLIIRPYLEEKSLGYIEFQDDGISGESIDQRPGFAKLLARIEAGEFETLVVFDTDRIGRFKSRQDKAFVIGIFENHLKSIYTYDGEEEEEHFNAASEIDMDRLEDGLSEARRENLRRAKKIRSGMRRARGQNRFASGRIPFGLAWDNDEKSWLTNDPEHATLQEAIKLIKQGKSGYQIEQIFNGIENQYDSRRKDGKWTDGSLTRLLKRNFYYTGRIVSKKHGTKLNTGVRLFSKDDIEEVRFYLKKNKKEQALLRKRDKERPEDCGFLLYRIVKCTCGWFYMATTYSPIVSRKDNKPLSAPRQYYRCKRCSHGVKAEVLDLAVWKAFVDFHKDPEKLKKAIMDQAYVKIDNESIKNLKAQLKSAKVKVAETRIKRDELQVEYFTKKQIEYPVYEGILAELNGQLKGLEEETQRLEISLEQPAIVKRLIHIATTRVVDEIWLIEKLENMEQFFEGRSDLTEKQKGQLVELLEKAFEKDLAKVEKIEDLHKQIHLMKHRILADLIAKGGEIIVDKKRKITMKLAAKSAADNDDNLLSPSFTQIRCKGLPGPMPGSQSTTPSDLCTVATLSGKVNDYRDRSFLIFSGLIGKSHGSRGRLLHHEQLNPAKAGFEM